MRKPLLNLGGFFKSFHNGNFVNGLTNYVMLASLMAFDVFGAVLAFKASLVLGLITLLSGPIVFASVMALAKHCGGYNFWQKFMPAVTSFASAAYWFTICGLAAFIAHNVIPGFNPLMSFFLVFLVFAILVVIGFKFNKLVQNSLYNTFFLAVVALSPVGFIFGITQWWMGFNLAHYLVAFIH